MIKCYLGSLNKVKLAAVKEVFADYQVIPLAVESGVRAQPLTDSETIQGAKNRAMALPEDGIRIGLEAGVQMQEGMLFLVNWGVLIDLGKNIYYAGGTRIPLPDFIKEKLLAGEELADVMEAHLHKEVRTKEGAIGYLTEGIVKRKDIFVHIVKLLYGQYKRKGVNE
jgi:inosine/xanthosine triphosphatase